MILLGMSTSQLPQVAERVLRRSQADQLSRVQTVNLRQRGRMRLGPGKRWLPFKAQQRISVERLQFRWEARVWLAPWLWVKVTDAFEGGRGRLEVALWGVIPIKKARGSRLGLAQAQRYLAELPWYSPALYWNETLRVQALGPNALRVWAEKRTISVDLYVDERGDIVRAHSAERYREGVGNQPWEGTFQNYAQLGGLRVPLEAAVAWLEPYGRFEYWRAEIEQLELEFGPGAHLQS